MMKFPFTQEQFLNVFKIYNQTVFPAQIFLYLIAIIAVFLLFKKTEKGDKIINSVLAFLWIWMGVVYHLIFFTGINKAAYIFGIAFIIQGILFIVPGITQNKISFSYKKNIFSTFGIILIIYALIIYPVLGYLVGHIYPVSPTFGLPCPTTIFTFGVLLFSEKKISLWWVAIPLIWSVIGFSAAINLSIYEDTGLLLSGLIFFSLMIYNKRKKVNTA